MHKMDALDNDWSLFRVMMIIMMVNVFVNVMMFMFFHNRWAMDTGIVRIMNLLFRRETLGLVPNVFSFQPTNDLGHGPFVLHFSIPMFQLMGRC